MNITCELFTNRELLGTLVFNEISVDVTSAVTGNTCPVEAGQYRWLRCVDIPFDDHDARASYGAAICYFGTNDTIVALHGGSTSSEGELLPTEATLRVSNRAYEQLLVAVNKAVAAGNAPDLLVTEHEVGFLRRLTAYKVCRNEQPYVSSVSATDDHHDWVNRFREATLDERSAEPLIVPGGGAFDGGGASDSWQEPVVLSPAIAETSVSNGYDEPPVIAQPFVDKPYDCAGALSNELTPESTSESDDNSSWDASPGGGVAY
jgi:hypothetical protein